MEKQQSASDSYLITKNSCRKPMMGADSTEGDQMFAMSSASLGQDKFEFPDFIAAVNV